MKKILFCCIAIVLTITSCQNIENESFSVAGKDQTMLKTSSIREFCSFELGYFMELGRMHNEVSLYALDKYKELLEYLSDNIENGDTIYVNKYLLEDYLLHHITEYVASEYGHTNYVFDCGSYNMYKLLLREQYLLRQDEVKEFWEALAEELDEYSISMTECEDRIEEAFNEYLADNELDYDEAKTLVATTVALHSVWLWDNIESMIESNLVIDNSARRRTWWKEDVCGAVAGFMLGGGNVSVVSGLIGAIIGAAIASVLAAVLNMHIFVKESNGVEYPISYVYEREMLDDYELFGPNSTNPYLFRNE